MQKLQWHYESHPDLGVPALAGQLGAADVPRLTGAMGWTLFHGGGPLILDLSAPYRWTTLGQDAIVKAAARLQTAGRTLDIAAAAPGSDTSIIASASPATRTHPALIDALTAHSAAAGPHEDQQEWRSGGWPETGRDRRILS